MNRQSGFTIAELLVVIFLLSIALTGFYQVLFSAADGSDTANDIVQVSENARLGFNRMVRDTREADGVSDLSANAFTVGIDFNTDNVIDPSPPADELGSYETLTYRFNSGAGTITVTTGGGSPVTEVLMTGVSCVRDALGNCEPAFTYASSRLEYDTSPVNGVTSAAELNAAQTIGDGNLSNWTETEESFVDRVTFALRVTKGQSFTDFHADAQLRNRR